MDSALRPRDIQARIRAGESPESVAAAAQTSLDKIMGFATPVLAERAHIALRAQRASVRRKAGEGPNRPLGEAVAARLEGQDVDPATVEWDAWRREDGRWTLVADYGTGDDARHAEFVFDAPGSYVVAEDDEARWLVGDRPAEPTQPAGAAGAPRLSPVAGSDQPPLGEDAIELVSGAVPDDDAPGSDEPTEDLSATAAALRGGHLEPTGDADWIATQASERPARAELGSEADLASAPDAAASAAADSAAAEPAAADSAAAEPAADDQAAADEPRAPRRTSKKGRRASVPSWDEIMFGGGKSD